MSKNNRPLTADEIAQVAVDADRLLAHLREHARPAPAPGEGTVVKPIRSLAREVGLSVRGLNRAEQYLASRHLIRTQPLLPRNEKEGASPLRRWIVPNVNERTGTWQ